MITTGQLVVFVVILSAMILFALSAVIFDYIGMIAKLFKDKPWCGYMEVWNGKGFDPVNGSRVSTDIYGEIFKYKYNGVRYEVRIGVNYPSLFVKRGRLIRCRPGFLIALPLGDTNQAYDKEGKPYEPQFTEEAVGLQTYGWSLVEWNKSIRGKGATGILTFILIGVIVLMAIGGIWYYQTHKNSNSNVTNPPGQTITVSPIPTLKPIQGGK